MSDPTWATTAPTQPPAPGQSKPSDAPTWNDTEDLQGKFGTLPQQALTVAEGLGKGFVGPVATAAEKALSALGVPGLSPEEQAGREAANPITHGVSEVAGFGAGIATGTGEARLLEAAGEGALKLAGRAAPVGLAAKATSGALRGAIEGSLFQTGDEVSKRINDPTLSAGSAAASIGLGALLGGAAGGILGPITPYWRKESEAAVAQGIQDFKNAANETVIDHSATAPFKAIEDARLGGRIRQLKPDAAAIADAAARNEWPIAEGMLSGSKEINMAEDALLNGPPTIPSIARRKLYKGAYDAANTSVDRAVSAGASEMSETEAGRALKSSMTAKLEAENEPISALYKAVEPYQQAIPLGERSAAALSRSAQAIIKELGLVAGSDRYNFVKTFADGIGEVTDLQKLKNFRTEVNRSAGPFTKDLAADITERLNGVEERAIKRFASEFNVPEVKEKLLGLVGQLNEAKSQYRAFKTKLSALGKILGKKKVYGPQDFIDFIDEMNPQTLAKRLFNERNTEGVSYFAKHFPEEFQVMRGYQRGLIRQSAMKDGAFGASKAIKEVLGMEPELQRMLFTDGEIQTINDASKYLGSFPKSFNPSGTAHETAFRAFFEHPSGAVIANLRDVGIRSFIKAFGLSSPGSEAESARLIQALGKLAADKDTNPGAFKHAVDYTMSVIRGEKNLSRAAKSVIYPAIPAATSATYPDEHSIDQLDKKLKDLETNEDLHADIGGELGHYLPNHDIALKGLASNAVAYLNGIRPRPVKTSPLDPEIEPSPDQKSKFRRALAIAAKPLAVTDLAKRGRLTPQDVAHFNAIYPETASRLKEKITESLASHLADGEPVPQRIRLGLSMLLGHPMDSSVNPNSIQRNQAVFAQSNQQQAQKNTARASPSMVGMRDLGFAGRAKMGASDDGA